MQFFWASYRNLQHVIAFLQCFQYRKKQCSTQSRYFFLQYHKDINNTCLHLFNSFDNFYSIIQEFTVTGTWFQLGLPACVRVFSPVIRSLLSFLWMRSRAICSPIPFMSVLPWAAVMYMCISITFSGSLPSSYATSICSFSMWFSRPTNHSKDFWSRLIHIKSTYGGTVYLEFLRKKKQQC